MARDVCWAGSLTTEPRKEAVKSIYKLRLLVLTAVLMTFMSVGTSYGAEYRKDISLNQQQIAQFIPQATTSLRRHPGVFKRCVPLELEIDAIAEKELPLSGGFLYVAPTIQGMARRFQHVRSLTGKQLSCERRERWRATQRAALTECVRQVSDVYGVDLPMAAPWPVKAVICAASYIDDTPYIWGGGHASFESPGYDCSGAVSYALHGGGFLESPLDSTGLSAWGESGPGRWITVYANSGHAWMTIAGLTFDTSGTGDTGPGFHSAPVNSPGAYVTRHPLHY